VQPANPIGSVADRVLFPSMSRLQDDPARLALAVTLPLQVFAVVLVPRTAYKISGSLTRATDAVLGGAWRQWLYAAEVAFGCLIGSRWGITGVAVGASLAIVAYFLTMLAFSARIRRGLMGSTLRAYGKFLPVAAAVVLLACRRLFLQELALWTALRSRRRQADPLDA
jgi:PST family polysaccharide transporter